MNMVNFLHPAIKHHRLTQSIVFTVVFCFLFLIPHHKTHAAKAIQQEETASSTEMAPRGTDRHADYSKTDLRKGERLFRGLIAFGSGFHDCASCHYTDPQEEINWNPSVYDLAKVWMEDESYNLQSVMNNPLSMRLMEDHKGMKITDEETKFLEAYFHEVSISGKAELHTPPVKAAIFWGFGLLMLLALIDLLITKKIKYHFIHVIILVAGLGTHVQFAVAEAQNLGRTSEYAPNQPIKFSHMIHSGENKIDCRYCHHIADHSKSAGIPSNNVCLNCHTVVRNGTLSGSFEINKIHDAEQSGEPVSWVRVYNLPDHSFFSHAQHVNAGKLDCTECHGKVEEMHIVRQVEDLSMGWCLDCHRTRKVDFADNPYFEMYKQLHEDLKAGRIDSVSPARVGGEDCMKCHY
jgi:hypothetical protein